MSVYISFELQRRIRQHFVDCCAYCRTAEFLTVTTFEFEHIIPRSADGKTMGSCPILVINTETRFKAEGRGQKAEVKKEGRKKLEMI